MHISRFVYPMLTLIIGLTTITLLGRFNLGKLTPLFAVALIAGSALLLMRLHVRAVSRDLPWTSDDTFIESIRVGSEISAERILRARRWMARRFSVAPERLAPDQRLGDLAKALDILAAAYVGLNEIESEFEVLYGKAGEDMPRISDLTVAAAAGEFVRLGLFD
jgi:hypothetical protein